MWQIGLRLRTYPVIEVTLSVNNSSQTIENI